MKNSIEQQIEDRKSIKKGIWNKDLPLSEWYLCRENRDDGQDFYKVEGGTLTA